MLILFGLCGPHFEIQHIFSVNMKWFQGVLLSVFEKTSNENHRTVEKKIWNLKFRLNICVCNISRNEIFSYFRTNFSVMPCTNKSSKTIRVSHITCKIMKSADIDSIVYNVHIKTYSERTKLRFEAKKKPFILIAALKQLTYQ